MASSIEQLRAIESIGIPFERIKDDLLKGFVIFMEDRLGKEVQVIETITRLRNTYFSLQLRNYGGVDFFGLMVGGVFITKPGLILEILRNEGGPIMKKENKWDGEFTIRVNADGKFTKLFHPQTSGLDEAQFLRQYSESLLDRSATGEAKKRWEENHMVEWVYQEPSSEL